jgi:hypothetical protein
LPPFATSLAAIPAHGGTGKAGRTGTAVIRTIAEAGVTGALLRYESIRAVVAGLAGGTLSAGESGVILARYSDVPGVELTGTVAIDPSPPLRFIGTIKVTGRTAAHGTVTGRSSGVTGKLGGQTVKPRP